MPIRRPPAAALGVARLPHRVAIGVLVTAALTSCATTSPKPATAPAATDDIVVPNEHLRIAGIPPVPKSIAAAVGKYTEFKPVRLVAWQPERHALLVAYRQGATAQLHLLDRPLGTLEPITDFPDPVVNATFEPRHGDYLVYERDSGGNEASQLYRYDFGTKASTLLTDPAEKHAFGNWNHARTALLVGSVQLDRTAGSGTRETVTTELSVLDPLKPEAKRRIASLPGGGWGEFRWGATDRILYAIDTRSATDTTLWKIDVATGARTVVLPAPSGVRKGGAKKTVAYHDLHVTRDGKRLVYASDEEGEFSQLTVLELGTGKRRVLTRDVPWDVDSIVMQNEDEPEDASRSAAKRREVACAFVNVAGRTELHLFDLGSGREIALPALPAAARSGSIVAARFAASGNRDELAIDVASAQSPGDIYTLDTRAGAGAAAVQWSRATVEGVDASAFREAEIVHWSSFDGREISGLVNRPPARFTGKRPVLVNIHGGPEGQAKIGFLGRTNYLVDVLGVAVIQPNVRGSTGYGKTYLSLDDGMKREDSVKDIAALLDWIATQPDLDASRVMVAGGSYGGYMSLAVATNYSERIAASIDVVGISSFTTFLERTETYRRDLRRVEYGDERDPAMRAFFERISPLNNADRIRKPLFVVAGLNDPRVPYQEGEQIVAKVRANGVPVWHLVADNEGHGFARKPNADYQFYAQVLFMQQYLLQ